ncbi:hypothetical protein [Paractinoplanes atraurantiacus]|uniref:Abortive infection protein n=1 Tax=Paractinoplanes atraurantiacus TaxID=1036182 RepID=A0A285K3Z8_9ACTN|nr:hypothetical protein [Actinoplanes atraurantiacus]SNY66061.1 hypothetical protein SAMN05421748_12959 [Actinoplanes atraurantiacus]
MRGKGITYDTGFVLRGRNSRPVFDLKQVERELSVIRRDLHCTAVRISGGDPERIEAAAAIALREGLEVWFSPYPLELTETEMLALFADCARRAAKLAGDVVFVAGAELSLMSPGFLPGGDTRERVAALRRPEGVRETILTLTARINDFLGRAVAAVREHFDGPITYASVPLERVDWTPFDFVSVDLYRSAQVADQFAEGVRTLVAQGKPVAITEFGSATFRGAGDLGAEGLDIVEYDPDGGPTRLTGDHERDEDGQARYLRETLEVFDTEGVDTAFVFIFALGDHVHRPDGDPRDDLDLASYGIVKAYEDRTGETYPDMPWEPKAAFHTVAALYR